jgi:hypothetical protein
MQGYALLYRGDLELLPPSAKTNTKNVEAVTLVKRLDAAAAYKKDTKLNCL